MQMTTGGAVSLLVVVLLTICKKHKGTGGMKVVWKSSHMGPGTSGITLR